MPQVRRILVGLSIETAMRRRLCHRERKAHSIPRGGVCLVIKDAASSSSKNYCPTCALAILDVAADDLQRLRDSLS